MGGYFSRERMAGSEVTHLSMTTEWTKLLVFLTTVVTMGSGLALGTTLGNFSPTPPYLALTWLYYLTMEPSMVACLPSLLSRLSLPQFDMQETVWAQIILKTSSLALAFLTVVLTLSLSKAKAPFLASLSASTSRREISM